MCRGGGAMGEVLGKQDVLLRLLSELPAETLFLLGCVCKVQGYLAHKKYPLLGPYSRSKPRVLWSS